MSKSREQLEDWLSTIEIKDAKVLDIGCQDKPVSGRIHHENCEFRTLDIDPQWDPDYLMDICEDKKESLMAEEFDYALALETFEHLHNPITALENIKYVLKKNGTFIFSLPFINPLHDIFDYARYTPEGFSKLLFDNEFEVTIMKYRRATVGREDLISFYQKEGMRISKIRQSDFNLIDLIGFMGIAQKV